MTQSRSSAPPPRTRPPASASRADSDASGQATQSHCASGELPCLDSARLLQGHGSVAISHRGAIYRLQATRQGKLILTK